MNTREKQLNDMADKLANMQHGAKGVWKSRPQPMMLPNQILQVWLQQDVYDQNCKKQARRHLHGPQAEEYIRKTFGFDDRDLNEIDWESIKKLNQRLGINERATRSKYVF